MKDRLLQWLPPVVGALLFSVAAWVLHHELQSVHLSDLRPALSALPADHVLLALFLVALNYLILTSYDQLAFVYIRKRLARWRISMASFLGYAVSNSVGFALLSGTSVRYRFYSRWGLGAADLSRVVFFYTTTPWVGLLALGGCSLIGYPSVRLESILPQGSAQLIGAALLATVIGYFLLCALRRAPFSLRGFELRVPVPSLALAQLAASVADWALAAAVLYALLPADAPPFGIVLGIFLFAQILGLLSHIPGGLGVFEGVVVLLLGPYLPPAQILTALLLFRLIYYVLPLSLALLFLLADEVRIRGGQLARLGQSLGATTVQFSPKLLAIFTFLAGLLLLVSGAMPAEHDRLHWMARIVPIQLFELSHFVGSLLGVGLLILSQAVARRLNIAYYLLVAGLLTGITALLFKAGDWESALFLLVLLAIIIPGRSIFDRKAALFDTRFTPGWILAFVAAVGASLWLGLLSFRHVEYAHQLWWQIALDHDVSRFMRASVGATVALLAFGVWRLLRPKRPVVSPASDADLADAANAIAAQTETRPFLVYLRDKAVMFNAERSAFIMYGVHGRTWVALGDPAGPEAAAPALIRAFVDRADDFAGQPVFYQVHGAHLHRYAELGMAFAKLGEEARVSLDAFSLTGGRYRELRTVLHRMERDQASFRIVEGRDVSPLLPQLKAVSDDWLASRSASEKGFSLGYFDPEYLTRLPVAVMEAGGRVVAFANVLPGPGRVELSIDLMRYTDTAPPRAMDGLLAHLLLWGKAQGYRWFNLGMAPLSGLELTPTSPLWTHLGRFLYHHGETFYNFEGLRAYKEKFHPVWEPRYLAYPGGLVLPEVLVNIAALSAGSISRIFR